MAFIPSLNMANKKFFKYFKEYKWSNVFSMIRNNRKPPKICTNRSENKLVVITGATSGIGRITAHKYASMGADLICINRNKEKSEKLSQEIESQYGTKCGYEIADLSLMVDVIKVADILAQETRDIDVLIHNAGVYLTKKELTDEGFEKVYAVHYLASFVMNLILLEKFKSQNSGRIILVGSEGHRFAAWGIKTDDMNWAKRRYSGMRSYGSAKTAQMLSMLVYDKKLNNGNTTINSMHPGAVKTETGQENGAIYKWFKRNFFDKTLKSADISAEALYYLGISDEISSESGKFFNLTTIEEPAPPAVDMEVAEELWQKTIDAVNPLIVKHSETQTND